MVQDTVPPWISLLVVVTIFMLSPITTRIAFVRDASVHLMKRLMGKTAPRLKNTVNILWISQDQRGLTRNTQMSMDALTSALIPINLDTPAITHRLNRPVTLHHVNVDQIPQQISESGKPFHIGFLLWELEELPKSHVKAGKLLNDVWVPSNYVQRIYQSTYRCNVVNMGKGIDLPDVRAMHLNGYGITPDHHVVLMCFDARSSVERKNPLGAVLAFLAAFPTDKTARFILKTTSVEPSHWGDPNKQMDAIRGLASKNRRIIIDDRMLPFVELLSLIKRADCVVSSHRVEGFGYIPAYALWFARPVIATDFSGTVDFCTAQTSHPVPYRLIPTRTGETICSIENAYWADVDIEVLVNTLQHVRANPQLAQIKALSGQRLIRTRYSIAAQAKR